MTDITCRVEQCGRFVTVHRRLGVCPLHYSRIYKYGSTESPHRPEADAEWLLGIEVPDGSVAVPVVREAGDGFTFAVVDAADYDDVKPFRWRIRNGYASRTIYNGGNTICVYMHRWLMQTPYGMDTDHINWNKLDNRRSNLRAADRSTNVINQPPNRLNTSGHKGVSFFKASRRWRAYITRQGKCVHLGYFATKAEAIAVREAAEASYELESR